MLSTQLLDNETHYLSGEMICRHGGRNHSSWWHQTKRQQLPINSHQYVYNKLDRDNWYVMLYVLELTPDVEKHRNEFMEYIGGQRKYFVVRTTFH